MSEATKKHPTNGINIIIGGKDKATFKVPASKLAKILPLIKEYQIDNSVTWEELAGERIKKHSKPGLALKGARFKEGLTQIQLAKKLKVAQYNISKMENGSRTIGKDMAKKLGKALNVNYRLFL